MKSPLTALILAAVTSSFAAAASRQLPSQVGSPVRAQTRTPVAAAALPPSTISAAVSAAPTGAVPAAAASAEARSPKAELDAAAKAAVEPQASAPELGRPFDGSVKQPELSAPQAPRLRGTVKWFNDAKGFGFIDPADGGAPVFVHFSVIERSGYQTLREGEQVEFEIVSGPKGRQAAHVKMVAEPNPAPRPAPAPVPGQRVRGTVKWFNDAKGFGFIDPADGGAPVFVHFSVIEGPGYKTLREGEAVEFEILSGPKGRQAVHVKKLGR